MASALSEFDPKLPTELFEPAESDQFNADPKSASGTVFPQPVASGGPTPRGVVLWTRLDASVYQEDESLAVEVRTDRD